MKRRILSLLLALALTGSLLPPSARAAEEEHNFTNLVIFCRFQGEKEFIHEIYDGATVVDILDNTYNKSTYSVSDYLSTVSGGKLRMNTLFLFDQDANGKRASIELGNKRGHYAKYDANTNIDGFKTSSEATTRRNELSSDWSNAVTNAITRSNARPVDTQGSSYSFDDLVHNDKGIVDGDGKQYFDLITIIYKYTDPQEAKISVGHGDPLWAFQSTTNRLEFSINDQNYSSWNYVQLTGNYKDANGTTLYQGSDRRPILAPGQFCHETMHALGLKDLYRSSADPRVGFVSLMGKHTSPLGQNITVKEREALNWLDPGQLQSLSYSGTYTLKEAASSTGVVGYKKELDNNKTLYLEYRSFQNAGTAYGGKAPITRTSGSTPDTTSIKSGLVCYEVTTGVTFPDNLSNKVPQMTLLPTGAQSASCALGVGEKLENQLSYQGQWVTITVDSISEDGLTFTVTGLPEGTAPTPITAVTAAVAQPVKGEALSTAVTGTDPAAYGASVLWYEGSTPSGNPVSGAAKAGTVYTARLTLTAAEGYSFDPALHGTTQNGYQVTWNSASQLTLTRTFPATQPKALSSLTISGPSSLHLPSSSEGSVTLSLSAQGFYEDGSSADLTGSATWTVEGSPAGVSVERGTVTVTSDAQPGSVTILASSGGKEDRKVLTLTQKPLHALSPFPTAIQQATYGDSFTAPTVTCSTGGAVVYTSSAPPVATVEPSTGAVTIHQAGQATITALVEETASHAQASVSYTLQVARRELQITGLTPIGRAYQPNNTTVSLSGGTLTGVLPGDQVQTVLPTTGRMDDPNAGENKAVHVDTPALTGAKAGSYTLSPLADLRVNIQKATPTGTPAYTPITESGKTLAHAALSTDGSSFSVPGTVRWVDTHNAPLSSSTTVTSNTSYRWSFTPSDSGNYLPLSGSITLYTSSEQPGEEGSGGAGGGSTGGSGLGGGGGSLSGGGGSMGGSPGAAEEVEEPSQPEELPLPTFQDVPADSYYTEAVAWATQLGITQGLSPEQFAPEATCTRAQIVTFLWRAAGSPEPKGEQSFPDVIQDSYYAKAVAWAVEQGITTGVAPSTFAPELPCTRSQAMLFLYRAAGSPATSGSTSFQDIDPNYQDAVVWGVEQAITEGMGNGRFGSELDCTRAHIVTFLYRSMKK